jgi:hypothetical protein
MLSVGRSVLKNIEHETNPTKAQTLSQFFALAPLEFTPSSAASTARLSALRTQCARSDGGATVLLNCGPQRLGSELKTLVRYLPSYRNRSHISVTELLH